MKNIKIIKTDFPIFNTYPGMVYLDSAATSQKPVSVIDAVTGFYTGKNANIHRGIYKLAEIATEAYENARIQVGEFINAESSNEIIFTGNTNQAINLAAFGWASKFLKPGDIIVLSEMEHHANIVPWLRIKEQKGIDLLFLPIDKEYRLDYNSLENYPPEVISKIKLLALTHASNVLGTVNPLSEIIPYFKKHVPDIKILIDAAQSIPHMKINVQKLGIDFLAFSSHKMLGPSGVGVLWARRNLLEEMDPLFVGSNMIHNVTKENYTHADLPDKFEAGTANLEGVAGLSAGISYIQKIGYTNIETFENDLTEYALKSIKEVPGLKLFGPPDTKNRIGIFSFGLSGAHPHDIAQILDNQNIAIRSGHHCAQITMKAIGLPATARASLYLYNTKEDIDKLVKGLESVKKILKI